MHTGRRAGFRPRTRRRTHPTPARTLLLGACLLQVLREGSTELREMDVYCLDTVEHDRLLIDFHNMTSTVVAQVERG